MAVSSLLIISLKKRGSVWNEIYRTLTVNAFIRHTIGSQWQAQKIFSKQLADGTN